VIIPKNVAPGFYDLLHLIPKSARKTTKAQESVDKHEQASSRPTETGPTKRDTPTSAEIRKSKRAGEQQSAGDTRSADNTAANYFSVRVERAVGVYTRPPQQFDRFQFVHLTDLHLRNGEGFRLMHVIRSINSLQPRPAFAVLTGDIVEYGNQPQAWAKSIKYLRQLEIPLFIMIGNHDYYRMHFGQPKAQVGLLREEEGLHLFVRHYHPFLAYRFRFGGYNWLSVDTGTAATTKTWYQLKWVTVQGLGQEQLRDIREFLHKPARHGHILLAHASPRAHLRNSAEGCDMGRHGIFIRGRKELEEIMINAHDKHKRPIVYFFGHTHWNSMYARPAHRSDCRFLLIPLRYPMMGELPCWHNLPIWRSPLLISTQSATKHQPLRSGGILQKGSQFGEGAGAAYGFRLIDVNERTWKTAIYRFYYRTRIFSRKHDNGYIDPRSRLSDQLPQCKAYK
jgi:predicted MPP superfamily phosphohydrolase